MSSDDILFFTHELDAVVQNHRQALVEELDRMSDDRLLNTDMDGLRIYCTEKYALDFPELGEPQVDTRRVKMTVGRYGGYSAYDDRHGTVQVDAERFTLEIPFTGDKDLFLCRGNTWTSNPPRGHVRTGILTTSLVEREPNVDQINHQFEKFLSDIRQHLGWLKPSVEAWNNSISGLVNRHVEDRRNRAERANNVASGLKFPMKARSDRGSTFSAPVSRKRIAPVLPSPNPGAQPEPVLTAEAYREILDTLQQMSEVMERSPHAYAQLDEEALRFQFLVPLNARFEGEARGEVFNYGGKTDILITYKGRNIFVAECKFWKGKSALREAIDQLLGYLSWRDTKVALLLFNRNKQFTAVLDQIDPTVREHPNFVSMEGKKGATEFRFKMHQNGDPKRHLELTILAFDIPAPSAS